MYRPASNLAMSPSGTGEHHCGGIRTQNDPCYVMAIASRYVARAHPTPSPAAPCRSHPSRSPIYSPHLLASTDSSDGKYLATSLSTQAVKLYQRTEDGVSPRSSS